MSPAQKAELFRLWNLLCQNFFDVIPGCAEGCFNRLQGTKQWKVMWSFQAQKEGTGHLESNTVVPEHFNAANSFHL